MENINEKPRFTIEEASELGLGSVRKIRYMIKEGDIECIPTWAEGGKRQKRWIPRSELVRMNVLPPPVEVNLKLDAAQVLRLRKLDKHLAEVYEVKKELAFELWLPPLNYLPALDLSTHYSAYSEHTIYWADSEEELPIVKLPLEDEDNFAYFKQHTETSEFWRYLQEWKQLGGHNIRNQSSLLNSIKGDIQAETDLSNVTKDKERVILEGLSWVIFRNLFPQASQNEEKAKSLTEKAVALASEGRWYEAINRNKNIIKMFPADLGSLKRLGKAHMELQRYVLAKEAYSRALEIDPYDHIAQKILKELLQKYPDDNGIAGVDGGRYRIVGEESGLWTLAIFSDDEGEIIASLSLDEIAWIITTFQDLLRKYRGSPEVKSILDSRKNIDQLERKLFPELKRITLKMITESKCDGCLV